MQISQTMITIEEALHFIQTRLHNDEDIVEAAPVQEMNWLSQAGLFGIVLPGNELDFTKKKTLQLLQLLKAVGRANLSVARIYEGHINALFLIHLFATTEQKKKWFADAADGCLFGVWNTGNNEAIQMVENHTNTLELRGKKTFASGAGLVNRALVTGYINSGNKSGWQMCIVNMNNRSNNGTDYNSWKPLGMASSVSYTVDFTGYQGDVFNLFGEPDNYYQQPFFSGGAIRFCAAQLGGAEALFNNTVVYLKNLQRTDDAYQAVRIAEMATELASGNLWLQQSANNWDKWNEDVTKNNTLIAFINMTRTAIERICLRVIELSSKCIGARGLMQPYRMERIIRDLQFYLRQPAPDAAVRYVADYVIQSHLKIEMVWNDDNRII